MPRIVICPPKLAPKERLNRFGVSRPDNRRTEMPAVRPKRSSGLRRPAPLDMAALEMKARRALAKFSTEINERGASKSPVVEPEIAARFIPSTIPVVDVAQRKGKF